MDNKLLQSRLMQNTHSDSGQMPEDFSAQFEEFKTLAHSALFSDAGFLAIEQDLTEALDIIELSLGSKKKIVC